MGCHLSKESCFVFILLIERFTMGVLRQRDGMFLVGNSLDSLILAVLSCFVSLNPRPRVQHEYEFILSNGYSTAHEAQILSLYNVVKALRCSSDCMVALRAWMGLVLVHV